MKDIDNKLDTILNLVRDKEKPVTRSEMEEIVNTTTEKKQTATYRQVSEKPVVVDVMDISDAAAKKLAAMMSSGTETDSTTTQTVDSKQESTSIIGKLLGFAKDIFLKILGALGKVVGWVVGTLTSLLKQLSSWILKKIQTAMAMAVTRSMGGMGGRFRRAGLISAAFKLTAGALAAKGAYDMFQGFGQVESQLDNINSQTQSIFSDPESMISSGMVASPDFKAFSTSGSGSIPSDDGLGDTGGGVPPDDDDPSESIAVDDDQPLEDNDPEDDNSESPLEDINIQTVFPIEELDQKMIDSRAEEEDAIQQDQKPPALESTPPLTTEPTPPLTSDPEVAGKDLQDSVGMFKDAENVTPSDQDGKQLAKLLSDGVDEISNSLNVDVTSASGSSKSAGSPGMPSGGSQSSSGAPSASPSGSTSITSNPGSVTSAPSVNTSTTGDTIFPPFDAEYEAALDQKMIDSGIFAPREDTPDLSTSAAKSPELEKANINIQSLIQEASKTNKQMSDMETQTTPNMSSRASSPSRKNFSGSVTPTTSKPPASAASPSSNAASAITSPVAPTNNTTSLKVSTENLAEKIKEVKQSLENKQMNVVQKTETRTESMVPFVSTTDTLRAQTRNNGVLG